MSGSSTSTSTDSAGDRTADGRSRRWDDHKQERRDLILGAAVDVLREEGSVAGVKDIADRAGLPRSVVYRLFKDRADLDEQVRERIISDLMTALTPVLAPQGTIEEAIAHAVDTYVGWMVENPQLHLFLGTGSARKPTTGSRAVTSTRTAISTQVAALIAEVLRNRDADVRLAEPLAFAVTGMVDATANRWLSRSTRGLSPAEMSEFLQVSVWQLLDGNLRRAGVVIEPDAQVTDIIAGTRVSRDVG